MKSELKNIHQERENQLKDLKMEYENFKVITIILTNFLQLIKMNYRL